MTFNNRYSITSLVIIYLFGIFSIHAQTKAQWAMWRLSEGMIEEDTLFYKNDFKDKYCKYDFAPIWTYTRNMNVLGFIGNNYQRFRIKFISIKKDSLNPAIYHIIGKTMVSNNICNFKGTLVITNIRCYKNLHKTGVTFGTYFLQEDSTENHSGIFQGSFASFWLIDKYGKLKYDDDMDMSDGYCNNLFAGTWQSYHSNTKETCNWGDYRIPFSGDLDYGAGEFFPSEKYLSYGWKSYNQYFEIKTDSDLKKARRDAENWWK